MTNAEKLQIVKSNIGPDEEATDDVIFTCLADAQEAILLRRYPFGPPEGAVMPAMYERLQCRLATEMFLKRGADGEIAHDEDGVNRKYESADFEHLLRNVTQIAKVI